MQLPFPSREEAPVADREGQTQILEAADAFPPLKSAVGGVLALWDIAERAKHSKSDAREIARRTGTILSVIADAVLDGSPISPLMHQSIERFTVLLHDIHRLMVSMSLTNRVSRIVHLNRNESALLGMKTKLEDAYRDFLAASALRVEAQQATIASQQAELAVQQAKLAVQQMQLANRQKQLASKLSQILFCSGLTVFLANP
ncbi:hypothetical protein C8F04DRAFT_1396853 [Mycena alexandri]|uniref:Uncharacterized protein n=1 Tax=Mycena alexandri TaxID=1745969 RepID=A0AAD6X0D2_9AGAR|nr:hypothetical protein C8F04DRAFT_1396853 [Mycena alexandri]